MENGGNIFMGNRGQTGNNGVSLVWDHMGQINTTATARFDWGGNDNSTDNGLNLYATTSGTTTTAGRAEATSSYVLSEESSSNAFMFLTHHGNATLARQLNQQQSLYTGDGSQKHPDPHLVCLKLGKRHYFEDSTALTEGHLGGGFSIGKKGKPYYSTNALGGGGGGYGGAGEGSSSSTAVMGAPAAVPRCQVEGCHVALINAKDYHRRHKVCEMHSKAPKVVVLGLEQRFCQQCSRFHVVSEFDDSKRSCRRRLAGHNERRRKSSHDSASRNSAQDKVMTGRFPYLSSPTGRALSLLSSTADSWISPSDLSSRSSAALRELIAENRAAIFARQLIPDRDWQLHHHAMEDLGQGEAHPGSGSVAVHQHHSSLAEPHGWDRFHETGAQVTLDLMQASSSAFGILSVRGKTKEGDEDLWNSLEGTHVV